MPILIVCLIDRNNTWETEEECVERSSHASHQEMLISWSDMLLQILNIDAVELVIGQEHKCMGDALMQMCDLNLSVSDVFQLVRTELPEIVLSFLTESKRDSVQHAVITQREEYRTHDACLSHQKMYQSVLQIQYNGS